MTVASACLVSGVTDGCPRCGQPLDALSFDVSAIANWTAASREILLARFDLPLQYCGVLESVRQFTDRHATDPSRVSTPTLEWRVLIDRHPVSPFLNLRWIVNPWDGCAPFVWVRLSAGARVELIGRRVLPDPNQPPDAVEPAVVGGRITGRYWYDPSYGAPRAERHG